MNYALYILKNELDSVKREMARCTLMLEDKPESTYAKEQADIQETRYNELIEGIAKLNVFDTYIKDNAEAQLEQELGNGGEPDNTEKEILRADCENGNEREAVNGR